MKLTSNQELDLLNHFRYSDIDQPKLTHTMRICWLEDHWICTTNAHAAIFIRDNGDIKVYSSVNPVNIRGILPDRFDRQQLIPSTELEKLLSPPMITRKVRYECEACEGKGEFDHHGESYDCKSCYQEGYLEGSRDETIPDPNCYLKIGEQHLAMDRWMEIQYCYKRLRGEPVYLLQSDQKKHMIFLSFGNVIVLTMASMNLESYPKVVELKPTDSFSPVGEAVRDIKEEDHGNQ